MTIDASEISEILKEISEFDSETKVTEVGTVLTVGDGIARAGGQIMGCRWNGRVSGKIKEWPNLEEDNVGIVIFGNDREIKEGDIVKRTGQIVEVPVGKGLLGRVVDGLGDPIDGKASKMLKNKELK